MMISTMNASIIGLVPAPWSVLIPGLLSPSGIVINSSGVYSTTPITPTIGVVNSKIGTLDYDSETDSWTLDGTPISTGIPVLLPVLPSGLIQSRIPTMSNAEFERVSSILTTVQYPFLLDVLNTVQVITTINKRSLLDSVLHYCSTIPAGITLTFTLPAPYSIIVQASAAGVWYSTEDIITPITTNDTTITVPTTPGIKTTTGHYLDTTTSPAIMLTPTSNTNTDIWSLFNLDYTLLLLVHSRLLSYPITTITSMIKTLSTTCIRALVTTSEYSTLIPDPTPLIIEHNSRINSDIVELQNAISDLRSTMLTNPNS